MRFSLTSSRGFTLVEIMIVVVIIGLLAAMAIPAFQRVRSSSLEKALMNDARQIGSAAQQYMMEYGVTSVSVSIDAAGLVAGDLVPWVKKVGKNMTMSTSAIDGSKTDAFTLKLQGAFNGNAATFDAEGKLTKTI